MFIKDFHSYIKGFNDLARADRFDVRIIAPQRLNNAYGDVTRRLSLQCEASELPGRTLQTFQARTYGVNKNYVNGSIYSPLNLTFFCTGNVTGSYENGLWEKAFFDDWLELVNPSPQTVNDSGIWNIEYRDEYITDVEINHYDTNGKLTYSALFKECFPTNVAHLPLAWNNDAALLQLNVEFQYTSWERTTALTNQSKGDSPTQNDGYNVENRLSTAEDPNFPSPFNKG